MLENKMIEKGLLLAIKYHKDQLRKEGLPYTIHPVMVSVILLRAGFADEVVAAGACHDLLEDTNCSEEEIREACGEKVLEIVKAVTDDKNLQDNDLWEERKRKQIEKVRIASSDVKAVYLADKIHNLQSLLGQHQLEGKEMWRHFARGKEVKVRFEKEILQMLEQTWDHPLIAFYGNLIKQEESLAI